LTSIKDGARILATIEDIWLRGARPAGDIARLARRERRFLRA
jgi:hypothetical protein